MAIRHAKVSTKPDPSDTSLVGKTDWNADHVGTLPAGSMAHSDLSGLTSGDDHTQYQKESEKGAANGYASLNSGILVPIAQLPILQPSGGGHAAGLAPDPGASAGSTKFLREDAVWQVPPGTGNPVASDSIWDAVGDVAVGLGSDSADRLPVGADGEVLTADSGETLGVKWAAAAGAGGGLPPLHFVTGRWYGLSPANFLASPAGLTLACSADTGTVTATHNAIWASPWWIPTEDFVADRVGVLLFGGTSSTTLRLGLYDDDGTGLYPGALIEDFGTVDSSTTAAPNPKILTISRTIPFSATAPYWAVVARDDVTATSNGPSVSEVNTDYPILSPGWGSIEVSDGELLRMKGATSSAVGSGLQARSGWATSESAGYDGGALPDPFPAGAFRAGSARLLFRSA